MRQEVDEVRRRMNARAAEFAKRLLPNGRKSGNFWETSNIRDEKTGSYSLKVYLSGGKQGSWSDFGLARGQAGASGDILSLYVDREWKGDFAKGFAEAKRLVGVEHMNDADFARSQAESDRLRQEAEIAEAEAREVKRTSARRLWNGSARIAGPDGRTPALDYLEGRAINLAQLGRAPGSLRFNPSVWCVEVAERDGRAHAKIPAMIACVMGLDGELRGVHRTYLDVSAGKGGPVTKARLNDAKLTLGPSLGGHIPLWKGEHRHPLRNIPPGTDVYMSEGIEDGLSIAMVRPSLRVIAGVSLGKMGAVELPSQMGALVIIGQNDMKPEPIEALERAIAEQQNKGRTVRTIYPPQQFKDFNDMLTGKERGHE
ncbi:hypothetical protein AI27_05635 [Sphingomonas sp. BHC-A]|nr:hypothetical protein AI27_05635 [Sphingomonas sp. BHC-A]